MKAIGLSIEKGSFDLFSHRLPGARVVLEEDHLDMFIGDNRLSIFGGDSVSSEFPQDDPHVVESLKHFTSPEFFIVSWSGGDILQDFLLSLSVRTKKCLVDDDRGKISDLEKFISRLTSEGDIGIG